MAGAMQLKWLGWLAAGLALAACGVAARVAADEPAAFIGRIVVEWLDDDPFVFRMRMVEDFGYRDAAGRLWTARSGQEIDGRSIPPSFRDRFGPPFGAEYRKSAVLYDAYSQSLDASWREAQRMFFAAAVSEGVPEDQARLMYMALYAGGLRWEQRDSSCYRHCHSGASVLSWKPVANDDELEKAADWIRRTRPALDQIDRRLDTAIAKPGPHIFAQGFSRLPTAGGGLTAEPGR